MQLRWSCPLTDTVQTNKMNINVPKYKRKETCVTMEEETRVVKDYQGWQRATKS